MEEIHRDKETKLESYNPEIDHIMKCGHLSIYNCYIDSDKCALCDKIKIDTMDERLTTVEAHKTMNFLDVNKHKKRPAMLT